MLVISCPRLPLSCTFGANGAHVDALLGDKLEAGVDILHLVDLHVAASRLGHRLVGNDLQQRNELAAIAMQWKVEMEKSGRQNSGGRG